MRCLPALLLAVACSNGAAAPRSLAPTTPAPATTTPSPSATPSDLPTRAFTTPSHGIYCQADRFGAGCDVVGGAPSWSPPKPKGCDLDRGSAINLRLGPPARVEVVDCQSDTLFNEAAPVQPYGSSVSVGTVTCTVATNGVRCVDGASGKGFRISRESYDSF